MRLLAIFSTILILVLCSCRSSKRAVVNYADSASVDIDKLQNTSATDEIFSLLTSSRALDLSGVRIEFFPPDSAHPDSRAAPKSLTIDNAKVNESTRQATHEQAAVDWRQAVNLAAQSYKAVRQDTNNDTGILRPADSAIFIVLLSVIIISIFLIIKQRK